MAQTIKLKRSGTSGAIPTTSQLELGEVAINTYDGKMYIKKNVGGTESIVEVTVAAADAIVVEYQFTATANQTTFSGSDDNSETLSYSAGAVQIFLNGILLDSGVDYTATNGTSIVLSEVVDANDYLQVFAFKKKISNGQTTVDTFTGDNSTTAFTLSVDPGDENNTRVYIDGVYQSKGNYSVSGTTLTFSTAPPTSTAIEVEIGNRVVTLDTASNLDLPDDVKLRLGTDQDLQIYHDGTHSRIKDTGTGNLILNTQAFRVNGANDAEGMIKANQDGDVELYYDGSKKFETTSTGIDVTGTAVTDGLTVDGVTDLNGNLSTSGIISIENTSYFTGNSAQGYRFNNAADTENLLVIKDNGNVGIGTNSPLAKLHIDGDGTYASIRGYSQVLDLGNWTNGEVRIESTGAPFHLRAAGNQPLHLETNNVERVTVLGTGNVGIGTTSPTAPLEVQKSVSGNYVARFQNTNASTPYGVWIKEPASAANAYPSLTVTDNAGTATRFRVDSGTGNVGIGTGSPSFTSGGGLQVYNAGQSNLRISSTVYHTDFAQSGADTYLINRTTNGDIKFRVNSSTELLTLDGGTGSVGIAQTSPSSTYKLDVGGSVRSSTAAPSFALQETDASNQTWLMGSYGGTFAIRDVTGGTYPLYIEAATPSSTLYLDSTGNVGIGVSNPSVKLAVAGGLSVTSNITNNSAGHAYLTLNSAGVYESGIIYQRNSTNKWETYIPSGNDNYRFYSYGDGTTQLEIRDGVDGNGGTILSGLGVDDSTDYFGSYGALILDSNQSYTSSSRSWMLTNALKANTFGILYSDTATTKPSLTTYGEAASGTSVALSITNAGNVGIGTDSPSRQLEIFEAGRAGAYRFKIKGDTGYTGMEIENTSSNNTNILFRNPSYTQELYMDSSGKFHVYNNSTSRLTIDQSGNIGIGTDSPSAKLEILSNGSAAGGAEIRLQHANNNTNDVVSTVNFANNVGSVAMIQGGTIGANNSGYIDFFTDNAGTSARVARMTPDGNVGIGTTSPERALHVVGGIHLPNNNIISWDAANGTLRNAIYVDSGDDMIIGDTNFDDIYFSTGQKTKTVVIKQTTGRLGVGTTAPSSLVHASQGNQALGFDAGFFASANPSDYTVGRGAGITMQNADVYTGGIYGIRETNSWEGALAFYTHTSSSGNTFGTTFTEKMRITNDGNVGIGTTSPTSAYTPTLHISGANPNLRLDGTGGNSWAWITANTATAGEGRAFGLGADGSFRITADPDSMDNDIQFIVPQNGNVGIGTSSPTYKMEVDGGAAETRLRISTTGTDADEAGIILANSSKTAFNDGIQIAHGGGITSFRGLTGTLHMAIDGTNSRVGISTTSPNVKLEVQGSSASTYSGSGPGATIIASQGTDGNWIASNVDGKFGYFGIDGNAAKFAAYNYATTTEMDMILGQSRMYIKNNGNVGIGNTSPNYKLDITGSINIAGTGAYLRWQSGDMQIKNEGSYKMGFYTYNSSDATLNRRMVIDTNGNVGIGDTNPESQLEVNEGSNYRGVHTRGSNAPCFTLAKGSTSTPEWRMGISGYDGSDFALSTGSTVGDQMRMDDNGNTMFCLSGSNFAPRTDMSATSTLGTRGPIISGYSQGSYTAAARNTRDWFVYAGPTTNTNVYVHMKTDLWGGGSPSGNTEYTMSSFTYHNYYAYGGSWARGQIGWHNWSGSLYNVTRHNEGTLELVQPSYISTDGYVVLVARIDASYAQFSIDWFQWGGYTFREAKVTAVTQHSAATGAY